jgi:hypothetical protein
LIVYVRHKNKDDATSALPNLSQPFFPFFIGRDPYRHYLIFGIAKMPPQSRTNVTPACSGEREFLVLLKAGQSKWNLIRIEGIENLPAVQWKLMNINEISARKQKELLEKLTRVLGMCNRSRQLRSALSGKEPSLRTRLKLIFGVRNMTIRLLVIHNLAPVNRSAPATGRLLLLENPWHLPAKGRKISRNLAAPY